MKTGRPPPPFVKVFHKILVFFKRWLPLAVEKVKEAVLGQNNANLKDLEHYSGDDSTAVIRNLILPSP